MSRRMKVAIVAALSGMVLLCGQPQGLIAGGGAQKAYAKTRTVHVTKSAVYSTLLIQNARARVQGKELVTKGNTSKTKAWANQKRAKMRSLGNAKRYYKLMGKTKYYVGVGYLGRSSDNPGIWKAVKKISKKRFARAVKEEMYYYGGHTCGESVEVQVKGGKVSKVAFVEWID